jgi:GT2 family glycosyltransferase
MDLSVIIVSFNVRDFLKQCLETVIKASENINVEIFVIDNSSDDDSCTMVELEFPQVILIKNKTNRGFSAANNQAIRKASGRYILLLNPDTVIEDDTLTKCIEFMDIHPGSAATGVRMVNGEGKFLKESKRAFPTPMVAFFKTFGLSSLFPGSGLTNKYYLPHIDSFKTSEAEIVAGAFMFIRREVLNKTGLLDEDFFMYGEDIDLSYRFMIAGYTNYYFAGTQITHFKGKSTSRDSLRDICYFYNSMRIFLRKRVREGNYRIWQFLVIPGIFLREMVAIINRLFRILLRRLTPED